MCPGLQDHLVAGQRQLRFQQALRLALEVRELLEELRRIRLMNAKRDCSTSFWKKMSPYDTVSVYLRSYTLSTSCRYIDDPLEAVGDLDSHRVADRDHPPAGNR